MHPSGGAQLADARPCDAVRGHHPRPRCAAPTAARPGERRKRSCANLPAMTDLVVVTADHGAVRVLTLNRPESRNALSRDLIRALYDALTGADADDRCGRWYSPAPTRRSARESTSRRPHATGSTTSRSSRARAASPRSPRCARRSSGPSTARCSPAGSRWRWAATS